MHTPHTTDTKDGYVLSHDETLQAIESQTPPIEVNSEWIITNADGSTLRRIRILAPHPDGGYLFVDKPSAMVRTDFAISICPEYNLRRMFRLVT